MKGKAKYRQQRRQNDRQEANSEASLTIGETKRLLYLVRIKMRDEKPWPMFRETGQLESIEQKLLHWYNNGARV